MTVSRLEYPVPWPLGPRIGCLTLKDARERMAIPMILLPARAARRFVMPAFVLGLCLLAAGCNSQPKVNDGDLVYIEDNALMEAIAKREKKPLVIVDARSAKRYEMAHIPGAISIPLPDVVREDKRLKDKGTIIVYALDWEDPIAMAMSKKLMFYGYKEVQTYRGGLREWVTKGRETEPPIEQKKEDPN